MTYVSHPAVIGHRTRPHDLVRTRNALLTVGLLAFAALLGRSWWNRGTAVPLTWQWPGSASAFLLPAAPVVGLLAIRCLAGGRLSTSASQRLTTLASRWSWVWCAVTSVWTVATVASLSGQSLRHVALSEALLAVMASSDAVAGQAVICWVSLLVALFGGRMTGHGPALGLLSVTMAAALFGAPLGTAATHEHGTAAAWAVMTLAGGQLLAVIGWLGAVISLMHVPIPAVERRDHLIPLGRISQASGAALGVVAVFAGMVENSQSPPGVLIVGQLVGIAAVAGIGLRHRLRTVDSLPSGHAASVLAVGAGEFVLLGAVVMVGAVLPISG